MLYNEYQINIFTATGLSKNADKENEDLKYTYELHDDFSIFPTYANLLSDQMMLKKVQKLEGIPAFNLNQLLHAEQLMYFQKPLNHEQKYKISGTMKDIQDKTSGILITYEININEYDDESKKIGDLAVREVISVFIRGLGGSQFKGTGFNQSLEQIPKTPKTEPDFVQEQYIDLNLPVLHRLAGDKNPIHIDPKNASKVGFKFPIVHGMNTYAIALKIILKQYLALDDSQVEKFHARFTGFVYPGETLIYKFWKQGNTFLIDVENKERKTNILKGYIKIKESAKL
ncbi:hypothetical protein PPERSA_02993 [Pseudocohnilembus persalinus]|uniref:Uncharacterized protein n=1 Tax=Pseudocohnilembus persalinus TaxID=266149 RepID=A0A0V0QEY6_PSEPJ|nr:hypothetical protein PPERSA_02993 [Pseudocohnilembus persalinus]|eukprot:KRX00733.1 hypothetical protein PPERSA_02993 [Pseudocohnilembus persalinus]